MKYTISDTVYKTITDFTSVENAVQLKNKLTATQIKNKVVEIMEPTAVTANGFYSRFLSYAESRTAKRTKEIYLVTAKRMAEYDAKIKTKTFEDITKDWLSGFDAFLLQSSPSVNVLYLS